MKKLIALLIIILLVIPVASFAAKTAVQFTVIGGPRDIKTGDVNYIQYYYQAKTVAAESDDTTWDINTCPTADSCAGFPAYFENGEQLTRLYVMWFDSLTTSATDSMGNWLILQCRTRAWNHLGSQTYNTGWYDWDILTSNGVSIVDSNTAASTKERLSIPNKTGRQNAWEMFTLPYCDEFRFIHVVQKEERTDAHSWQLWAILKR